MKTTVAHQDHQDHLDNLASMAHQDCLDHQELLDCLATSRRSTITSKVIAASVQMDRRDLLVQSVLPVISDDPDQWDHQDQTASLAAQDQSVRLEDLEKMVSLGSLAWLVHRARQVELVAKANPDHAVHRDRLGHPDLLDNPEYQAIKDLKVGRVLKVHPDNLVPMDSVGCPERLERMVHLDKMQHIVLARRNELLFQSR